MTQDTGRQNDTGVARRRFMKTACVAVGAGATAGCIGGSGSQGTSSTGDQNNQSNSGSNQSNAGGSGLSSKVTVTHWPLLMYTPPYHVALDQGFFADENIDITSIVGSSGGGTTVRNVVTGGLPFGEVATPAAVNAYYAGAPLSIIASATNTPGTINWVAPKGSEVKSISDLKGKTAGFTAAGSVTQNTLALTFERADGISVDDVEFRAMGGVSEGLTAVKEGGIAAAANLDPIFSSQQQGNDMWQVVFWARDYIDTFQQTVLIAGPDVLENRPDAVRGYLRARAKGVDYLRENPDKAAEVYAAANEGYNAEAMRSAIKNVGVESYYTTGGFSTSGLKVIEEGMKNIDLIDRNVEWGKIVDQSFLPKSKRIDLSTIA